MGGSADVWGEALDLLAKDHRVIAYDRRGFTRSSHAPVGDIERHREDAAALLRALDAAPATVVGWSSGGSSPSTSRSTALSSSLRSCWRSHLCISRGGPDCARCGL